MKKIIPLFIALCSIQIFCLAQDPEFPKGEFIIHAKIHNGMATTFRGTAPDTYLGGLQVIPQYTLIENKVRAGAVAGFFYGNKKLNGLFGITSSVKLKTLKAGLFGSGGNVHLSLDHLWGTQKQRLLGGGINLDLGNKLVLSFMLHRDYKLNNWWLQNGIAFRLSKVKQPPII